MASIPENQALAPARPGQRTLFLRPAGCPSFLLILQSTLLVEMGWTASGRAFPLHVRVWGVAPGLEGVQRCFVWVDPMLGGSQGECPRTAAHDWEGFLGPGLPG